VLLGVFAGAACTELPTVTEAPTDGGALTDAGTPTDSGTVDGSVEPVGDGGPKPDAGRPVDCRDRGMAAAEIVELASGPAYCDQGWTLVLKADGTSPTSQWLFDSSCWTGPAMCPLAVAAPAAAGAIEKANEVRMAAFDAVAGKEVRIVTPKIQGADGSFVYAATPTTLRDALTGTVVRFVTGDVPAFLPALPPAAKSGQYGLGLGTDGFARVRIGFVGGGANPTAWSGVGGKFGTACFPKGADPSPSTGSVYAPGCGASIDQLPILSPAVSYVYVR
jgi:hypothetical protein